MVSIGFNIYFLATQPKNAGGIFNRCKYSILEVKAESENYGTSYGSGEIVASDGTNYCNKRTCNNLFKVEYNL